MSIDPQNAITTNITSCIFWCVRHLDSGFTAEESFKYLMFKILADISQYEILAVAHSTSFGVSPEN